MTEKKKSVNPQGRASQKAAAPVFHLFLPRAMSRPNVLRWLKRVHAWTGVWGAMIFLFVGFTGVLLNHKAVMKIDTGAPQEVMSAVLPVEAGAIGDIDDLGRWGQENLGLAMKPRVTPLRTKPDETVTFLGKTVQPAKIWRQRFYAPNAIVYLEYMPGATGVKATKVEQNLLGFLKNLHKGAGLGVAWVLFFDMVAGALIAMSITGILLWSRLHGSRLAAIGLVIGSLVLAGAAMTPSMM